MKHLYSLFVVFVVVQGNFAQTDTIPVSKDYKTILVLPEPFSFSINGKDLNFIESFPNSTSTKASHIVMLAYNAIAPDITDYTNYTIYTKDGLAYDFILELVSVPKEKRWTISKTMADNLLEHALFEVHHKAIADERETMMALDTETIKMDSDLQMTPLSNSLYDEDRTAYFEKNCKNQMDNKGNIARYFAKTGNVFLWLHGIYYDREELYFQITLENKEPIDLDINFLKSFIGTNYRQSSSNQKSEFPPLHRVGQPQRVKGNSSATFFVIFEKFTLDKNKHLVLELDELNGNRNISLEIEHQLVNRPKKFGK